MSKKSIAVVLSGCGVYDGAEIHESVLTLLALDQQGVDYQCFAPDVDQHHVINHLNGEEMDQRRNVLVEAARIARGDIKPLGEFSADEYDAMVFPGGFGAAKNLSSFAIDGAECTVEKSVVRAVQAMHEQGKPIAALCISPVLIARLLPQARVTIGQDDGTAKAIEAMGGVHIKSGHGDVVVDEKLNLITSPCYMLDASISQIAEGASNTVKTLLERI
jgi:enhancing lycopene biosynthesis protein 2